MKLLLLIFIFWEEKDIKRREAHLFSSRVHSDMVIYLCLGKGLGGLSGRKSGHKEFNLIRSKSEFKFMIVCPSLSLHTSPLQETGKKKKKKERGRKKKAWGMGRVRNMLNES